MLITCPECNRNVSDKAISCPSCGYPINLSLNEIRRQNEPSTKPQSNYKRKKKHKKLPNGFGSIKYLGKNRRNPYAAYPPVQKYNINGSPVTVPAIGYYKDWYTAFDALREYNHNPYNIQAEGMTFEELYKLYYNSKYENSKKTFSMSSKYSTRAAFNNCSVLHNRKFKDLKKSDLQEVIDNCTLKHSSLELIVNLFHGMYKYAIENDFMDKDYSQFVTINIQDDDENGEPFSQEELNILWKNKDIPGVDTILIMIYSGFRISAYENMEYNLQDKYFKGGVKTKAGKDRLVPIHNSIYNMVAPYNGKPFYKNPVDYRKNVFYPLLEKLGILITTNGKKHTPHDTRHTFSWLCDKYKVDDLSKHLLMGHVINGDIEKSVYGHRTLEELRYEINKIQV